MQFKISKLLIIFLITITATQVKSEEPHFSLIAQRGNSESIELIKYSRNGQFSAVADSNRVIKVLTNDGTVLNELSHHAGEIISIDFSPDNKRLAVLSQSGEFRIWDLLSGRYSYMNTSYKNEFNQIIFSPDQKYIAVSNKGNVDVFSAFDLSRIYSLNKPDEDFISNLSDSISDENDFTGLSFSGDSNYLAAAHLNGNIYLWDMLTGELHSVLSTSVNKIYAVFFSSKQDQLVAIGLSDFSELWNFSEHKLLDKLKNPHAFLGYKKVSYSAKTNLLVLLGKEKLTVWNLTTREKYNSGLKKEIYQFDISPDGTSLMASVKYDYKICYPLYADLRLIDLKTQEEKKRFLPGPSDSNMLFALSPNSDVLAANICSKDIIFWDIRNTKIRSILKRKGHLPNRILFSPDGNKLAIGTYHGFELWDINTNKKLINYPLEKGSIDELAFSEDGKFIAAGTQLTTSYYGDKAKIFIFDVKSNTLNKTINNLNLKIESLAFLNSDKWVGFVDFDHKFNIYSLAKGKIIYTLEHKIVDEKKVQTKFKRFSKVPNSNIIAIFNKRFSIKNLLFWDYRKKVFVSKSKGESYYNMEPAITRNGLQYVAKSNRQQIEVINTKDQTSVVKLETWPSEIISLGFNYDSTLFLTAHQDGVIQVRNQYDYSLLYQFMFLPSNNILSWKPNYPYYAATKDSDKYFLISRYEKGKRFLQRLNKFRDKYKTENLLSVLSTQ